MMAETGTITAKSEEKYYELLIFKLLSEIGQQYIADGMDLYNIGTPLSSSLTKYVDKHFTNGYRNPKFELYNLQNGLYVKVGEVNTLGYTETDTIIYLGNTTKNPDSTLVSIPMS